MRYSFKINEKSLAAAMADLKELNAEIRDRTMRAAFREWGRGVIATIIQGITWNAPKMRKAVTLNMPSKEKMKNKNKVWCGIGVRVDGGLPGWMTAFYNTGFRVWQKGKKVGEGTGKGWRSGKKEVGATKHYPTSFMDKAFTTHEPMLANIVSKHISAAVNKRQASKKTKGGI